MDAKYHLPDSVLSEEGLMSAVWGSNVFLSIELIFQKEKLDL